MSLPICGVKKCCGPCTYSVGDLSMPGSDLGSWVNYIAGSISIAMPGLGTSWNVFLRHSSTSGGIITFQRAYNVDGTVEVRYLQNPSLSTHRAIYLQADRADGSIELTNSLATPTSPNNWSGSVSGVFVANPCNYSIQQFTPSRIYTAIREASLGSLNATLTFPTLSPSDFPASPITSDECKAEVSSQLNAGSPQSLSVVSYSGITDGWVLSPSLRSAVLPTSFFSVQTQITIPSGTSISTSPMTFTGTLARGYSQAPGFSCVGGGSSSRLMTLLSPPFGPFSSQYFGDMTANNYIYNNAVLGFTP
jgi:hypothetical protein